MKFILGNYVKGKGEQVTKSLFFKIMIYREMPKLTEMFIRVSQ